MIYGGFLKNGWYPKTSKSLDHLFILKKSIEHHGDLGYPHVGNLHMNKSFGFIA